MPISAEILILLISIRRNPLVTGRGSARLMAFYLPLTQLSVGSVGSVGFCGFLWDSVG
jgi:hypothetical protein